MGTRLRRTNKAAEARECRVHVPDVRVQLSGAPQLVLRDTTVLALERREAALLALIAIEGPTARSKAAALLWAAADTDKQRSSLRQRVFQLRRRAGCDVIPAGEILALADTVEHDLTPIAPRLHDDPDTGRGELLGDFDYSDCPLLDDWVAAAREQWRTARVHALAEIAARFEAESRVASALPYAERLVAENPTLEHAHRRLMRLHYLRGDRAAALNAFRRCQQLLTLQLGAEPGGETLELARLIERSGAPQQVQRALIPVAILRPPRLVGRDCEWAQLADGHTAGRVVLVTGEPGIGKTRLIADYAAAAAGTIIVSARPGDSRIPYALLARMLATLAARFGDPASGWATGEVARVVPEFGAPNAGKVDTVAFQRALSETLAPWVASGLSLIVLDDAQHADEATLAALPALAAAPGMPLAWIIGCRANEMPQVLADWGNASDTGTLAEIRLGPLRREAIEALLETLELPGLQARDWAEPLQRHTGGNPLFILETLRALIAQNADTARMKSPNRGLPAPPNVGELIGRRLQQLRPGALSLARVAAVAGQDFTVDLAAHVLRRTTVDLVDDWIELEAAHIIKDSAFAHDLIYEAALRSVPDAIAQALQGDIAAFLQERRAPAARIAPHWRDAHEWQAATAAFEAAVDEALHGSRREDELHLIGQAVDCAKQAHDQSGAFRLQLRAVDVLLIVKPVDVALALTGQLLDEAMSDEQRLEAMLRRTYALLMASRFVNAVEVARSAAAMARRIGATVHELDAVRYEALGLANSGQAVKAVQMLREATPRFERSGELLQQYKLASDLGHTLGLAGRWPEAIEAITQAIELAEQLGDVAETIVNLTNVAGALSYVGRLGDAVLNAERARTLRLKLGCADGTPMAHNDMILGALYIALGRYREALQAFAHAEQQFLAGGAPMWIAVNANHLAFTFIQLGQLSRAGKLLSPDDGLPVSTRARRLTMLARAEQAAGRPGETRLRAALELLGAAGSATLRLGAQLDLARELTPSAGLALSRQVGAEAGRLNLLALAQSACIREVDCLLRADKAVQAAARAQSMLVDLRERHPTDLYLAEAWWFAFRALDAVPGCEAQAREALLQGVAWINETARNVPDEFRDSFLHRNPINRAILTTATRQPGTATV